MFLIKSHNDELFYKLYNDIDQFNYIVDLES